MLKQRIMTAIILIALLVGSLVFAPPLVFMSITILLTLGAAWEWTALMSLTQLKHRLIYLGIIASLLILALFMPVLLLMLASIWWLVAALFVCLYPRGTSLWAGRCWVRGVMGCLVLVPCWSAIYFTYYDSGDYGLYILLYLFILIWGADSAAYFVGKKWGSIKLAPAVSPGKSVQGFVAALCFACAAALAGLWYTQAPAKLWPWAIGLSIITVLFSIVGDLFESMLKRQVGIKDSGKLLPGHGGILDRIDSLTAAAPIYVLAIILIGIYLD